MRARITTILRTLDVLDEPEGDDLAVLPREAFQRPWKVALVKLAHQWGMRERRRTEEAAPMGPSGCTRG